MLIKKNLVHEQSVGLECYTPSRTQQQFKEECDVNNILRKYVNTGILTHTSGAPLQFGDFSQVPADYGEALDLMKKADDEFMKLPAELRERFDSQPLNLINFLQDEKNRDEAIKLGLIKDSVKAEPEEE